MRPDGNGGWVKTLGTAGNAGTVGIVTNLINSTDFNYITGGLLAAPGSYTDGANYFLSTTLAGKMMIVTEPESWYTGQIREFIGTGTPQGLMIEIDVGDKISDFAGGGGSSHPPVSISTDSSAIAMINESQVLTILPNAIPKAFTDLTDVIPEDYIGRAKSVPIVTDTEDMLDLIETEELLTEVAKTTLLADMPPSLVGYQGYSIRVKLDETGFEFYLP